MTEIATRTEQLLEQHGDLTLDDLARAAWTILTEPGDSTANRAITALGAVKALELVLDGTETIDPEIVALRERVLPRASSAIVSRALMTAQRFGITLLTPSSPNWPIQLSALRSTAPVALWVRGNPELLNYSRHEISTALVGARAATGYGEHVAMEISAGLVDRGHQIVSGGAYGIDGMSHRAALASHGSTIAFLAGGLDRYYPSGHDALLTRIAETGAVVSELPAGVPPTKFRFLQRNRLIAAYSARTVILEAGYRSGSLHIARHALDLDRPVGAVPGPVTSAASAGCHRLLRETAATLVTNAEEVAEM